MPGRVTVLEPHLAEHADRRRVRVASAAVGDEPSDIAAGMHVVIPLLTRPTRAARPAMRQLPSFPCFRPSFPRRPSDRCTGRQRQRIAHPREAVSDGAAQEARYQRGVLVSKKLSIVTDRIRIAPSSDSRTASVGCRSKTPPKTMALSIT